jgi:hypothetical protein
MSKTQETGLSNNNIFAIIYPINNHVTPGFYLVKGTPTVT